LFVAGHPIGRRECQGGAKRLQVGVDGGALTRRGILRVGGGRRSAVPLQASMEHARGLVRRERSAEEKNIRPALRDHAARRELHDGDAIKHHTPQCTLAA
jgi:hypothetical protein